MQARNQRSVTMSPFRLLLLPVAMLVLLPAGASTQPAEEHFHAPPEKLGGVHFATSCASAVRPAFERGVALLHSFGYGQASAAFAAVAAQDPRCAMAQWGIALSNFHVIWGPPTEAELAAGRQAARKAAAATARGQRERHYVTAVNALHPGEGLAHP